MNSEKQIVVDLSGSRITAMAAEVREDNSIKIIAEEYKDVAFVKHGIVEQASGAAFVVNELVRLLQNSARIPEVHYVCTSVGAKSMKLIPYSTTQTFRKNTEITEDILAKLSDEVEQHFTQGEASVFDVIPVSYELNRKRTEDPLGIKTYEITAYYNVVLGNVKIKTNLEGCFDRTGIALPDYIPLSIDAVAAVVLDDKEREDGCALIHFGYSTTTLAVYADGVLQQLLIVPLGGNNITKDIQELGISESNAERLKCLKGCAMENLVDNPIKIKIPAENPANPDVLIPTQFLATIIEARLEEITKPIFEAIDNQPFELGAGIVLTGGGSQLEGLLDFVSEKTQLYTRFGNHSDYLSKDTDQKFEHPAYAQLVGTMLLTHEYDLEHPEEEKIKPKEPKIKKKSLKSKVTDAFFDFFNDDNSMN